jgi:chloramphenicol-sensitive protein RarD
MKPILRGTFFALAAYVLWGILPIYWRVVSAVTPMHILACRILFSLIFVSLILLGQKNTTWISHFRDKQKRWRIILSALLVTANWGLFIFTVNTGHTLEASLGYYINPLVSVLLGLIFLKERLKKMQWVAFGLAAAGVIILTAYTGTFPWMAFALALTFGFYGFFKKNLALSALEGLSTETLAALPIAVVLLLVPINLPGNATGPTVTGLSDITGLSLPVFIALVMAGPVTATPLWLFAKGAKLIPLSTLGFCQFATPTLQFLCGIFLFHETFPLRNLLPFSLIWAAAIIYIFSSMQRPKGWTKTTAR